MSISAERSLTAFHNAAGATPEMMRQAETVKEILAQIEVVRENFREPPAPTTPAWNVPEVRLRELHRQLARERRELVRMMAAGGLVQRSPKSSRKSSAQAGFQKIFGDLRKGPARGRLRRRY